MSGDRARLLLLLAAIVVVLVLIAVVGGCDEPEVVSVPAPTTTTFPPEPATFPTVEHLEATVPPVPPQPSRTAPEVPESRAVVSTVETVVVLGDAERDAVGIVEEPASTLVETTVVTSVVPDPVICARSHPNQQAVSDVIRRHLRAVDWEWACRVSWCESNWVARARNPSGATGLFQIMPFWHSQVPSADPWTFDGSARLARHVLDRQGRQAWSCK